MGRTLFRNVMVLDGSGAAPFQGEVLIEGNRIRTVARAGEAIQAVDAPSSANRPLLAKT
jgi:N-acyl-D-aspartate/D-glutamate deacylase